MATTRRIFPEGSTGMTTPAIAAPAHFLHSCQPFCQQTLYLQTTLPSFTYLKAHNATFNPLLCKHDFSRLPKKSSHYSAMLKERNAYKNTTWSLEGDTGYVMPCLMEKVVLFKGCRHILSISPIHRTVTAAGQCNTSPSHPSQVGLWRGWYLAPQHNEPAISRIAGGEGAQNKF